MSSIPFGKRLFAHRNQISQLVGNIAELADFAKTPIEPNFTKEAFQTETGRPIRMIALGDTNAGKSSFLNALFRTKLCKTSKLPETKEIHDYIFSASHTHDFLRDFSIIDTPGINAPYAIPEPDLVEILGNTDYVFFIFSADNPWSPSTWNLISSVPKQLHSRCVLIIQQADLKTATDLSVIREHMNSLCINKIGHVLPIFAVSSKAILDSIETAKNRAMSGFQLLENHLDQSILRSTQLLSRLQIWRKRANQSLVQIDDQLEGQVRALQIQNNFLSSLEREIDEMRAKLVSKLPTHLKEVGDIFEKKADWVAGKLLISLGPLRSSYRVLIGDQISLRTEEMFIEILRKAVESVAASDGDDVVTLCREHCRELDDRVQQAIGRGLEERESIELKLNQARQRFVERISEAATEALGRLYLRSELEQSLRPRNYAIKAYLNSIFIFLTIAAVCGVFSIPWIPLLCSSIAGIFAIIGLIMARVTSHSAVSLFHASLLNTCDTFADRLRSDYEDGLSLFFRDYVSCLNSVQKYIMERQLAQSPIQARWSELFLTLKALEQENDY